MKNVLVVTGVRNKDKKFFFYKKEIIRFLVHNCKLFKFVSIDEFDDTDTEKFDTLIALGGDGTVYKVLPKVINTDKNLAIIPLGTGNLLAAHLGVGNSIDKALEIISNNKIKIVDVMSINDSYSILRFGIGFDFDVISLAPDCIKKHFGYFAYFISGIIAGFKLKCQKYEIQYDNIKVIENASGIIVANASNMYKNLVSVANNSSVSDGFADVFILKTNNPITFFIEFLMILCNRKKSTSRAKYFSAKNIIIKNTWIKGHIDGEIKTFSNDINISLISNAVRMYCN